MLIKNFPTAAGKKVKSEKARDGRDVFLLFNFAGRTALWGMKEKKKKEEEEEGGKARGEPGDIVGGF